MAARCAAGSYTLTRAPAKTLSWTPDGKRQRLESVLPQRVGQTTGLWVRVAEQHRHLMRLLILRVPEEVAEPRRADLETDAKRRQPPVRQRAWELAAWTILLTDAPAKRLSSQEALLLLRDPRIAQRVRLSVIDTAGGVGSSKQLSFDEERNRGV